MFAKKAEADRPENIGIVDCVLTFTELVEWFEREGVSLAMCEESRFDEQPPGEARFFPLVGGEHTHWADEYRYSCDRCNFGERGLMK